MQKGYRRQENSTVQMKRDINRKGALNSDDSECV